MEKMPQSPPPLTPIETKWIESLQSIESTFLSEFNIAPQLLLRLAKTQMESRIYDVLARFFRSYDQCFYTIGSSGHEGNVVWGEHLTAEDWGFLHYRSGALVLSAAKKELSNTANFDLWKSFVASSEDPVSGGRHKVLGLKNMPPQTSTIASHLPKAVGTAIALGRNNKLKGENSLVFVNLGDASFNHASTQTALNLISYYHHQHWPLPLIVCCEDNGIGISVHTPRGWIEKRLASYGIEMLTIDGSDLKDCYGTSLWAVKKVRRTQRPIFIHFKTVRLMGHAGSDIESGYLPNKFIEEQFKSDPLIKTSQYLIQNKIFNVNTLIDYYNNLRKRLYQIGIYAINRPKLTSASQVMESLVPTKQARKIDWQNIDSYPFTADQKLLALPCPLGKIINFQLQETLHCLPQALVFGEDVAKKGGVYNITAGLFKQFGVHRVFNTLLDETNILGMAQGFALAGYFPIPEIQFLAYFHNAEDQLRGEMSTLSFFSNQRFANGTFIRIAGLSYQKGFGGHFHNDNSLTIFRDIPGIILLVGSHPLSTLKRMRYALRQAYEFQKIVVFIEPIALYPVRDLHQKGDDGWCIKYADHQWFNHHQDIDEWGVGDGIVPPINDSQYVIVSYGNGYYLSCKVARELESTIGKIEVIDLGFLKPSPLPHIKEYLGQKTHILMVDECRKSGSFSEEFMAFSKEHLNANIKVARHCAHDCFIPLGDASALMTPTVESIATAFTELLGAKS